MDNNNLLTFENCQREGQKVLAACEACRKQRKRCSGTAPCVTCTKRGENCVFLTERRRRGPSTKNQRLDPVSLVESRRVVIQVRDSHDGTIINNDAAVITALPEDNYHSTLPKPVSSTLAPFPPNPRLIPPTLSLRSLAEAHSLDDLTFHDDYSNGIISDPFLDLFDEEHEENTTTTNIDTLPTVRMNNDHNRTVPQPSGSSSYSSTPHHHQTNVSLSILSPDINGIHNISYPLSSSLSPDTDNLSESPEVPKLTLSSIPCDRNEADTVSSTSIEMAQNNNLSTIVLYNKNTTTNNSTDVVDMDHGNTYDPLSDLSLDMARIILPPQPTDPIFCLGNTRLRLIHDFFTKRNIYCSSFPILDPNSFFSMLYNIRLQALSVNEEHLAALQDTDSEGENYYPPVFNDYSSLSSSSSWINSLPKRRKKNVDELYHTLMNKENNGTFAGTNTGNNMEPTDRTNNLYENLRSVLQFDPEEYEENVDDDDEGNDGTDDSENIHESSIISNTVSLADIYGFRVLYLAVLACGAVSEGRMDVASKLYTAAKSALGPCFSVPSQYLVPALILLSMLHRNINADWGETCVLLALAKEMIFMVNVPRETRLLLLNMSSLHAVNKEEDDEEEEDDHTSNYDGRNETMPSRPDSSSLSIVPTLAGKSNKKKCKGLVFPSLVRSNDQDPLERLAVLIDWCISIIMKDYDEWKLNVTVSSNDMINNHSTSTSSSSSNHTNDYDKTVLLLNEILTIHSREERLSQSPIRPFVEGCKSLFCFKNNQITDGIRYSITCINGAAIHPLGTHSGMLTLLVYRLMQQLQYLLPILSAEHIQDSMNNGGSNTSLSVNPFETGEDDTFLFSSSSFSSSSIYTELTTWKEKIKWCIAKMTVFLRMADKVQGNYGVMTFVIGPKTIRRHNSSSSTVPVSGNIANSNSSSSSSSSSTTNSSGTGVTLTNCGPERSKIVFKRRL